MTEYYVKNDLSSIQKNVKYINLPLKQEYSFKYQDVVCDCCGEKNEDFYYDNGNFNCKKCKNSICCTFIYETIEDALKRANKLNEDIEMEKQTKIDVIEMIQENIVRVGGKFFKQKEIYEMKVEELIEILTANNIHVEMNIEKHNKL